jgi:hypothetical protein
VAEELIVYFPDGVYFVSLAPIGTPNWSSLLSRRHWLLKETGERPLLERLRVSERQETYSLFG